MFTYDTAGTYIVKLRVSRDGLSDELIIDSLIMVEEPPDPLGTFVLEWGSQGMDNGQFQSPTGLAVDSDGNVFVSDFGNYRIQKLRLRQ